MTDRIYAYTVTLSNPTRSDDAEQITKAIEMIKGVESVVPLVTNPETYWALEKATRELQAKLIAVLYPEAKRD